MPSGVGVSVVIPTFNRADLVLEAVASALGQQWSPLEVIVVDDASSDDTVARLNAFAADEPRLRVIARMENGGESEARNQGILAARHEYVALLDSDNRFMPEKLERQMPALLDAAPGAVSFTAYLLSEGVTETIVVLDDWKQSQPATIEALLVGCCVNTSTLVAPRAVLIPDGLFRPGLTHCGDHDLWLRLAVVGHQFVYTAEPLTWYRLHDGSVSSNQRLVADATERVIAEFLQRPDLPEQFQARRDVYASRWALNAAVRYLAAGDGRGALAALARAAKIRPRSIRAGWLRLAARALQTRA